MAYQAPPPKFTGGDLVNFRGNTTCVVLSSWNQLGFNRYKLVNLDNGAEIHASSHDLVEIPVASVDTEVHFTDEYGPAPSDINKPAGARFERKTEEEINVLASKKTEKSTDRQTSWAVRIFKGNLMG